MQYLKPVECELPRGERLSLSLTVSTVPAVSSYSMSQSGETFQGFEEFEYDSRNAMMKVYEDKRMKLIKYP